MTQTVNQEDFEDCILPKFGKLQTIRRWGSICSGIKVAIVI